MAQAAQRAEAGGKLTREVEVAFAQIAERTVEVTRLLGSLATTLTRMVAGFQVGSSTAANA